MAGSVIRGRSQKLTREEAPRLHTMGQRLADLRRRRKGSIEPEKLADLVVLNADDLTVPENQIVFLNPF